MIAATDGSAAATATTDGSEPGLVAEAPSRPLRALTRRFLPFARPYRLALAAGLPLLVALPLVEAVEIWLFTVLVDDVLVPRDLGALPSLALAYVGLALLAAVLGFADDVLAAWVGERFTLDVRERVFAHLQSLSLDTLDRRRLGDLLARLGADVEAIESFLLDAVAEGIGAVARIVFFCGALLLISWQLALVALVVAPVFYLASRRAARLVRRARREERRRGGALLAVAEESLGNAALVQALNRQEAEVGRFRAEGEAAARASLAATRVRAIYGGAVGLIELVGVLGVIALGTALLANGSLTLGGLLGFVAYLSQLYSPVRQLGRLATAVFSAAAGAERVLELLEEAPRVRSGDRVLDSVRGEVRFDRVSYRYPGAGDDALRGVDLTLAPGETVAVTGASGAGKSTLARLALRFDDPGSGSVTLDEIDLRELDLRGLREHVALLAQEVLLPDAAVAEVIGQGRPGATRAQIEAAARAAGADEFVRALPAGYDTPVGQRGRRLSGGQRQRLAIARALLRDAPVLVLDEPTTGLDAAARDAVLAPLGRLMEGRTVLLVSHDPAVVAYADRVVHVDGGRVEAREVAA